MLVQVDLVGGTVRVGSTPIHPGIDTMPQLCLASFVIELQVGFGGV